MAKAFKCDNCLALYEGNPASTSDGLELCANCVRVINCLQNTDPFDKSYKHSSGCGLDVDWYLHKAEHW